MPSQNEKNRADPQTRQLHRPSQKRENPPIADAPKIKVLNQGRKDQAGEKKPDDEARERFYSRAVQQTPSDQNKAGPPQKENLQHRAQCGLKSQVKHDAVL